MSSISGINQASLTALSSMNRLGQQLDAIASQVATGEGAGIEAVTQLTQVGQQMQANLLVLSKVQDLARDLVLQPRK